MTSERRRKKERRRTKNMLGFPREVVKAFGKPNPQYIELL